MGDGKCGLTQETVTRAERGVPWANCLPPSPDLAWVFFNVSCVSVLHLARAWCAIKTTVCSTE